MSISTSTDNRLSARREPQQVRAHKRHSQILDTTASLLDEVGFDDLTTILIAKRLRISVGALYHYFPNKLAILYALAERWVAEVAFALDDIDQFASGIESLSEFADYSVDRMLVVYRRQQGILPLVRAMYAVPELRVVEKEHDQLVINRIGEVLKKLGFSGSKMQLRRVASSYLEVIHGMSILVLKESAESEAQTIQDLKVLINALFNHHQQPAVGQEAENVDSV